LEKGGRTEEECGMAAEMPLFLSVYNADEMDGENETGIACRTMNDV
jgi:hypothetical protein